MFSFLRSIKTSLRQRKRLAKKRKLLALYSQSNSIQYDEKDLPRLEISIQGKRQHINNKQIRGGVTDNYGYRLQGMGTKSP